MARKIAPLIWIRDLFQALVHENARAVPRLHIELGRKSG